MTQKVVTLLSFLYFVIIVTIKNDFWEGEKTEEKRISCSVLDKVYFGQIDNVICE